MEQGLVRNVDSYLDGQELLPLNNMDVHHRVNKNMK
jgi:hypothetical protein